jgi:signal transduction histidine kinase/CheY-like chemotaxis protein
MRLDFKRLLESWSTQQDYVWFLALLAWGAVLAAGWRRKENAGAAVERWVLVLAASHAAGAVVELVLLAQSLPTPYTRFDFAMGLAQAGGGAALAWSAWAGSPRSWGRRGAIIVTFATLAVARVWWPVEAGCGLAVAQAAAVLAVWRRSPRPISGAMAALLVLLPIVATHGPWASAIGQGRRVTDWSYFALFAAGGSAVAGALFAAAAWRRRLQPVAAEAGLRRDLRRAVLVLAVWLGAGVLLAIWSGRQARRAFEENLLHRVEMVALALDPAALDEALGPALKIESIAHKHYPDGSPVDVALAPHTAAPVYAQLRAQLHRIQDANPDFFLLYLGTWRQGHLLVLNADPRSDEAVTHVIHHEVTPEDLGRLAARAGFLEGPMRTAWGTYFSAKAPVLHSADGRLLGWVVADVHATRWAATFTQARLQTMALVGVGVGLWTVAVAYRLRREARDAAEQKAHAAAAADRMKSAFLAQVSHELRTPIQSVLGYGELLAAAPLGEPHRTWLESLRAHGGVMLRLVNDLIDLGALQSGVFRLEPAPVALRALVEECAAALRPAAAAKRLAFHVSIGPGVPPWVRVDGVRLRQVLLNLLNNAVKFTHEGRVELTVAPGADGHVEFTVADTGPGIPAALRARLFQPFARLDPAAGEGSGLGLALVRALCAAMGGGVELVGEAGPGATFVVRVPLPVAEAPRAEFSPAPAGGANFAGRRVLVAEDNTLVRELLTAFLVENGAEVAVAADGPAALALARSRRPDVLLLDIALPGLDGIAVAEALRREPAPHLRIIGLSAHAGAGDEARARAAGMDVFLAKPVSLARLADAIAGPREPAAAPALDIASRIADEHLRMRLVAQFVGETPRVLAEMRAALVAADWPRLRGRAHYLKNSADVLGATALQDACQRLATAGDPVEPASARGLLERIEAAIPHLAPDAGRN